MRGVAPSMTCLAPTVCAGIVPAALHGDVAGGACHRRGPGEEPPLSMSSRRWPQALGARLRGHVTPTEPRPRARGGSGSRPGGPRAGASPALLGSSVAPSRPDRGRILASAGRGRNGTWSASLPGRPGPAARRERRVAPGSSDLDPAPQLLHGVLLDLADPFRDTPYSSASSWRVAFSSASHRRSRWTGCGHRGSPGPGRANGWNSPPTLPPPPAAQVRTGGPRSTRRERADRRPRRPGGRRRRRGRAAVAPSPARCVTARRGPPRPPPPPGDSSTETLLRAAQIEEELALGPWWSQP